MLQYWPVFEKKHRTLPEFIGNDKWQHVPKAVEMRNKMVHGASVYNLTECREKTAKVRAAMGALRNRSIADLDCDPWATLPSKRKSSLLWLAVKQPKSRTK